jgi:hypothetical protein
MAIYMKLLALDELIGDNHAATSADTPLRSPMPLKCRTTIR